MSSDHLLVFRLCVIFRPLTSYFRVSKRIFFWNRFHIKCVYWKNQTNRRNVHNYGSQWASESHCRALMSRMDLVVTCLLCVLIILGLVLLTVKSALSPTVPLRGKTNVPDIPGVLNLPILGHAWKFMGASDMRDFNVIMEGFVTSFQSHGFRAGSVWLGSKLMIQTADAALNEHILNSSKSNKKEPEMYGHMNKIVDGVFTRNDEGWSDLRKPLNKFLQPKTVVGSHIDVMVAKSEELCKALGIISRESTFNIHPHMQLCALEMTLETLMGVPGAFAKLPQVDLDWGKKVATMWFTLIVNVQYKLEWLFRSSKTKKELDLLRHKLRHMGETLINCRKCILAENLQDPEESNFEPECYTDVAIKQAIKEKHDGHTLPLDLIGGGYDAPSVALSTACLFLAMHPEYQERAYQEQIEIMGDTLRAPSYEETTKMDYLGMVYLETLRHVGAPAVVRQMEKETVVDDLVFPEGASMYVALRFTHNSAEYWEKPKDFYPDHFLPEKVSKRPKGAFLPFSAGARVCPGKAFALISSKIVLSMLLRRFHFTTTMKFNEMEYNYHLMLESVGGYRVQLRERTTNIDEYQSSTWKRNKC